MDCRLPRSTRNFIDARISDAAARESDLLAFQIGIEIGQPASVMCSYNKVNGAKRGPLDFPAKSAGTLSVKSSANSLGRSVTC